jgi:hypothetical protein
MRSATCLSRSSSGTVDGTEVPTEARTRVDTTEDSVDLDISSEAVVDRGKMTLFLLTKLGTRTTNVPEVNVISTTAQ